MTYTSRAILLAIVVAAACGGDSRPAPSPTTPTNPTPAPSGGDRTLRVAVLLSASRVPSSDDVRRVVARADEILFQKTGEHMSQVDLYSNPDTFTACSIVHEFMHPFGREGNFDHYGTAPCATRTGMSLADAQSLSLFQQSCGMCPDLYTQFRHR